MNENNTPSKKRFRSSVIITVALIVSFAVISVVFAISTHIEIPGNLFSTGTIDVEIVQDKDTIITENFKPGKEIAKQFTIQNKGTSGLYYKAYFSSLDGELKEYVTVRVVESVDSKENLLFEGKATDFISTNDTIVTSDELLEKSERLLTIYFTFDETVGNEMQNKEMSFTLTALAVQSKNNQDKEFNS